MYYIWTLYGFVKAVETDSFTSDLRFASPFESFADADDMGKCALMYRTSKVYCVLQAGAIQREDGRYMAFVRRAL